MARPPCRAIVCVRHDNPVPTPPPPDVIRPYDDSPDEIESRAELELHLATGTLAGLTVQGVPLDADPPPELSTVDVTDTLFVGCRFASADAAAELVRRGRLRRDVRHGRLQLLPSARRSHPEPAGRDGAAPARRRYRRRARRRDRRLDLGS